MAPMLMVLALLGGEDLGFTRSVLQVADAGTRLALRDVDGDGDRDLLVIDGAGVGVRLLTDGAFSATDDRLLPWPAEDLAWTLVDLAGDGRTRLACFVGAREVRLYRLDGPPESPEPPGSTGPDAGELVLAFEGSLPRGRFEASFFRDVDGDGRPDLVLPARASYAIHLRAEDGSWAAPLEVRLDTRVGIDVGDPQALDASFGQVVRIPWFELEDVDGDGDVDLVARTDDAVQFHLAEPVLSSTSSWTLDLAALKAELPPEGDLDLANVLEQVSRTVDWRLADLDGVVPNELVVQVGRKFLVYRDAARTGPGEATPQVLKASGNVLTFFLRDVLGSELPDLQILRADELSVATLLRWLVLPGSFDFELFTYENRGGTFDRRPTRRNGLELELPRLLPFLEELEELEEELETTEPVPARRVALDPDGLANDVLDVQGGELLVFRDRAPENAADLTAVDGLQEAMELLFLEDMDGLGDGERRSLALRDLIDLGASTGAGLREACAGAEPDAHVALAPAAGETALHVLELNGNGAPDVLVATEAEDGSWTVQLLVR